MGETIHDLEERLSQLVPRGLSEEGQERIESEIDKLAAWVGEPASTRSGHPWIWVAAACVVVSVSVSLLRPDAVDAAVVVVEKAVPGIEYLASQVQVTEMTDEGWGLADGAAQPHRYWINMVTETEDLLDQESGYQVKVVSEREVVVPVLLTHL